MKSRTLSHRTTLLLMVTGILSGGCAQVIPDGNGLNEVSVFDGAPATPRPLRAKDVRPHPDLGLAANNFHEDGYNSDVSDFPSPLGIDPKVLSRAYGICSNPLIDSQGRVIVTCQNPAAPQPGAQPVRLMRLLDPDTLLTLASIEVSVQPSTGTEVGGGNYPHLTRTDAVITGGPTGTFDVYEIVEQNDGSLAFEKSTPIDLAPYLPADDKVIFDLSPDYEGTLWFVSAGATVGYVDQVTGEVFTHTLEGEKIENGFAIGKDGVFVLTSAALYRFEADKKTGEAVWTWREEYEAVPKPPEAGVFSDGSGTTPTLLGDKLIAIVDNAADRVNLLVYNRQRNKNKERLVCEVPLFESDSSASDVSVIGYGRSLVAANWYGAPGPILNGQSPGLIGDYRALQPGLTRIDMRPNEKGCDVVWDLELASTTVPKLSTVTGLIYTYTQKIDAVTENAFPKIDAWYLTAVDFETGSRQWDLLMGTGPYHHNAFLLPTIGPNGAVYHGSLGGITKVTDGADANSELYWERYDGMLHSQDFRDFWAAESQSYNLDDIREQDIVFTDCTQQTLELRILQLAGFAPPPPSGGPWCDFLAFLGPLPPAAP